MAEHDTGEMLRRLCEAQRVMLNSHLQRLEAVRVAVRHAREGDDKADFNQVRECMGYIAAIVGEDWTN